MHTHPRQNLHTWFTEVGYLYVVVIVLVTVVFLLRDLRHSVTPVRIVDQRRYSQEIYKPD